MGGGPELFGTFGDLRAREGGSGAIWHRQALLGAQVATLGLSL